jgi:hypothetical protein
VVSNASRPVPIPPPPAAAPPPAAPTPLPQPPAEPAGGAGTSKIMGGDKNKSGLLVVLDDDQEMPASERFQKPGGARQTTSGIKVESFDEEEGKKSSPDLPDLPKL